jgi:hypothetical protein
LVAGDIDGANGIFPDGLGLVKVIIGGIVIAAGITVNAAIDLWNHFFPATRGNTPKDRDAQKKVHAGAVKEIERIIGRKLSKEELDLLHEAIIGQGYGFWEIVITGVDMFGNPGDLDKIPRDTVPEGWEWWK